MLRPLPLAIRLSAVTAIVIPAGLAAQSRSDENAVTQAEDAFGYSVGRESLGIYSGDNARGFSPAAAGNVRIDGLYFDPLIGLSGLIVESQSIKVGLSAQGYPFAAPSGIVDETLRRPSDHLGASVLANSDSYGSLGVELDGSAPLLSTLALGVGLNGGRTHFADGTRNHYHSEALIGRWRPTTAIEVLPYWSAYTDIDDQASVFYIPAGRFLPPQPRPGHFSGPSWEGINRTEINAGVLTSTALARDWNLRIGLFRSLRHQRNGYTYLMTDIQPDGVGHRTIFASPPSTDAGTSGEIRLTHRIAEGPRLHLIHFNLRGRRTRREFGGDDEIDLGTSSINQKIDTPRPEFQFGQPSHDRLQQSIYGLAYDGRWKGVGELSFGVSKTAYRKSSVTPDLTIISRASPLLYNGTLTVVPFHGVAIYGGYSRGFEESGTPPANAANRSEPLPAIITHQIDGGARVDLSPRLKAVAGVFDLSRPNFGFDQANRYVPIGTTRSRGAEFSLSGSITDRITIVAGGVLLDARVRADPGAIGTIGRRPVGIPTHIFSVNANWDTGFVRGLSFDAALSQRGRTAATTDNVVKIPARAQLNLGTRYRFALGKTRATARFQLANVFDNRGFNSAGPGVYLPNAARSASAYLTVDI
jgi:iron complex outermembrane recepter protein